jgi:hypothetical protein
MGRDRLSPRKLVMIFAASGEMTQAPQPRLRMVFRQPHHCLNALFAEVGVLRVVESPLPSALLEIS